MSVYSHVICNMSMLSESQTNKGIKCISVNPGTWSSEHPQDVLFEKMAWVNIIGLELSVLWFLF